MVASGPASHERGFIPAVEGTPDGLRGAESGNLCVACRGIAVYSPGGHILHIIEFPEQPANSAFGDPDLRSLYVTARTSSYRLRLQEKGSL